ncbi:MAG: signal peptidase II [Balneolaceae bacterium]
MTLKTKRLFVLFTPVVFIWLFDQLTKHWVRYSLELHRHEIIDGWLAFNYTQNPGMALGMDWLSTQSISVIAITATVAITVYILKTLENSNFAYLLCMGLILGGAFGNITDRLVMGLIEGYGGILDGHVIDFVHFTLTVSDTPVFPYIFNVADIAISTSIIVMLVFHKRIMPVEESSRPGGTENDQADPEKDGAESSEKIPSLKKE